MDKPVLIIGAGVVGLSLAHGLKKVKSSPPASSARHPGLT